MNTADYLLEAGGDSSVALVTNKTFYTYRELRQASAQMAAELVAVGVQPADRVAIFGNNSLFWMASYLATLKLGAVAVPFAPSLMANAIAVMQDVVRCKVVCAEQHVYRRARGAFAESTPTIFDVALGRPGAEVWPVTDDTDIHADAALMFTSGTTVRPRAVRITHRNIQANTDSIVEYLGLAASDRMLAILPFYYCFGTSLLHTHLRIGGTLVLSNTFAYPETILNVMEATECTGFAGVPSTYQTLLRNSTFPKRKLRSLRKVQQAGGKLQTVLIQELIGAVKYGEVYVMYGQTEATAHLSYLPPKLLDTKFGSIGRGIPGVTLRVIGENGYDVKPGAVGEIYAWGDNVSPGYLDEPQASAQKFVGGVLHTGDLATVDKAGFLYVVDREAGFIKSYGYRVSSQQVEGCILEMPDVAGAAVIGEPDLARGEAIVAFVVLRSGTEMVPRDIIAHCAERLPNYMVLKDVMIIDRLPINAHGKVVKNELRKLVTEPV